MTTLAARRRHPAAALVVLLLALAVLGGGYAAFAPASQAEVRAATSTQVDEGRRLFTIGCSSCHGLNAEGENLADGTVLGPSLIGVGAAAVNFQVGTGRMPMAGPNAQAPRKKVAYTDEQIDQLAAFVASLAPGPAVPDPEAYDISGMTPEQIARGNALYKTNCASCHSASANGGALTQGKYAPTLIGVEPVHMYQAMLTGPQSMPVFSDETLTSEDKREIIAFVEQLGSEPNPGGLGIGRMGPVSEGLWAFVIGIGALLGFAVWIGAKSH